MVGPGVFGLHSDEVLELARHEALDLARQEALYWSSTKRR